MRAALDTNAVVRITKDATLTQQVIKLLQEGLWTELMICREVANEFVIETEQQAENYRALLPFVHQDEVGYFTIGVSAIGGPDVIAPNTLDDVTGGLTNPLKDYEQYKKEREAAGQTPKDQQRWLNKNKHQSDAVIYSRALATNCDCLVTDDSKLTKRANDAGAKIKTCTLDDFLAAKVEHG